MSIINDYQLRIERWETPRNFTHYEDYIKFRRANMLSPIQQSYFSHQGNMVKEQPISRTSSAATLSISGSLSQNHLVAVSSKSAFYRRRNSAERRLILIVSALVILAIILLTALVVVTYIYLQAERVDLCSSQQCVQSAANLMASMDETVNPCDDFYKFSCGRWGLEHAIPDSALSHDWFTEKQSDMMRTIREYLKQKNSKSDPFPVTQARTMYDACMNLDQLEQLGLQPMMAIIEKVGLSKHPPIFPGGAGDSKTTSWMQLVVNAKKMLSMEVLVGIGVFSDSSDGAINRINVGAPETKSPLPSGSKSMDHHIDRQRRVESAVEEMTANELTYVKYIADVMSYLEKGEPGLKPDFTEAANKIQRFEKILWRELDADTSVDIIVVTIAELQSLSDNLTKSTSTSWDWTSYLTLMYEDVENATLDASNETVVVRNARYLGKMMELVSNTPVETLQLFIWWDVVSTLTPHTNRYLRDLRHNYIQQVSGDEMAPLTRSMFCAGAVNQMMGMAVSYSIAKPDFVNTTRVKVHEMLADIRTAFEDLVRGLDWMDGDTKMATMEKAKIMRSFVGFPDWLLVEGELDKEYVGIEVNASTYLDNMVDILQKSVSTMLGNLRRENSLNYSDR